ncbi:GDYXXLXY domain-containing protein [Paenibacillus sp. GP183]|uniref:GDYXXLXY domain-containing protein n=1 Tax=Paenibacillus sp. GP183 TaxID=1882751 RepID=UPI000896EB57|nr:GDYXXLXY domain-containing protein [Paenibacillus sp. GP183]SEB94428.1 Uncharacterized membrane-anchored protein [Paenibacillus sp. GP183]
MLDPTAELPAGPTLRNRRRSLVLIVLAALQIVFLLGVAVSSYSVLWYGQEIRIQTMPLDPRDPLYGDHVNLKLSISELSTSLWKESGDLPKKGMVIYVLMKRKTADNAGIYDAVGVYAHKPSAGQDEVVIKGRMSYSYNNKFNVEYGLEKFYVPENTGKALEEQARQGNMTARVKVAFWGRSALEGLEPGK